MIDVWTYLYIILIHWISDFVFQTRMMGENKGKSNFWLTLHVFTYSCWTFTGWALYSLFTTGHYSEQTYLYATAWIFILHWLTDFITSRITGWFYINKNFYGFFTTIGFDQVLHYVQLFLIYNYIILKK